LRAGLYGNLLYRLRSHFGVSEEELCGILRPYIPQIRGAFDASEVRISYDSEQVIAAYLLLYYPNYALAAYDAMVRLRQLLHPDRLAVAFFCGGSLPELLGTALCMSGRGDRGVAIDALVFDLYIDSWAWTHEISLALAQKYAPDVMINLVPRKFDFLAAHDAMDLDEISKVDFLVFQHCLNEFAGTRRAIDRIEEIGRAARPGSLLMFLDQGKYSVITSAMRDIRDRFVAFGYEVIEDCEAPYVYKTPDFYLPAAAQAGFFDGKASLDEMGNWSPGHRRARELNLRALIVRKPL